jgi:CheY-like chemotaxis protein
VDFMAQVVAAIPDLFFRAKVLETARSLSVQVEVARDADEILQQVRTEKPRLVLMDLQARALQPLDTLVALEGIPVVGFLAHEETELREQAVAAGCSEVLTKGQFSASLPAILRRAL